MLAAAPICGSSAASNFWLYIFLNNSAEWNAFGAPCLFWHYKFQFICSCLIIFEQKMWAEMGRNLAWSAAKPHAWCIDLHTHAYPGQHTRLGSLDDLGQCFLLPFANVITAAQPFLSAWTTEMSGARFFSGSLRRLKQRRVYLCLLGGGAGCLLRFTLRLAQRCS